MKRIRFADNGGESICPYCDAKNPYECVTAYKSRARTDLVTKRGRSYEPLT